MRMLCFLSGDRIARRHLTFVGVETLLALTLYLLVLRTVVQF